MRSTVSTKACVCVCVCVYNMCTILYISPSTNCFSIYSASESASFSIFALLFVLAHTQTHTHTPTHTLLTVRMPDRVIIGLVTWGVRMCVFACTRKCRVIAMWGLPLSQTRSGDNLIIKDLFFSPLLSLSCLFSTNELTTPEMSRVVII